MKRFLTLLCCCIYIGISAETNNTCNNNIPNWGESLGTISFATNETWTVGNQVWSDAVQTTVCYNRTTYNAGGYSADCRRNLGQKGDFFSACAIIRFGDSLCPYPWRVPTIEDFKALDLALGGNGDGVRYRSEKVRDNLLNTWGATFSGSTFGHQGANANYWALCDKDLIRRFQFCNVGWIMIVARANIRKDLFGNSLRCVRIGVDSVAMLQDSIERLHQQLSAYRTKNITLNQTIVEWFEITENLLGSIAWLREMLAICENNSTNIVGEHVGSPLQVFPNPVTNVLHITHEWQLGDVVELFDMNGRRVFSQPVETGHAPSLHNGTFVVDMTSFPAGTYILRIGNRVAKIVKR